MLASPSPRQIRIQTLWEAYDPEAYHGAPVGLQVMGQKLEEEKMLSVAETVVDALKHVHTTLG